MANEYQPQNTKDAMRFIEKLVNQYINAPITRELLLYNQKQINYLRQQVVSEAKNHEHEPQRAKTAEAFAEELEKWQKIRLSGDQIPGKMRHFKLDTTQKATFKKERGKNQTTTNYRTSNK